MTRDEIETGLKDAIVEALLGLAGKQMTDELVTEINQRSEWAEIKFAIDNHLEVEVIETPLGPQTKIVFDRPDN